MIVAKVRVVTDDTISKTDTIQGQETSSRCGNLVTADGYKV